MNDEYYDLVAQALKALCGGMSADVLTATDIELAMAQAHMRLQTAELIAHGRCQVRPNLRLIKGGKSR